MFDLKPFEIESFEKEIKDFVKGNEIKTKQTIIELMISDFNEVIEQLEKFASSEKPEHLAAQERSRMLLDVLPKNELTTYLVQKQLNAVISDFEKYQFLRLVSLVSNPYYIFEQINQNTLSFRDVENLAVYFPDLYELLNINALDALTDVYSKNEITLSTGQMLVFAKILNLPNVSPQVIKQLQANYTVDEEPDAASVEVDAQRQATQLQQAVT